MYTDKTPHLDGDFIVNDISLAENFGKNEQKIFFSSDKILFSSSQYQDQTVFLIVKDKLGLQAKTLENYDSDIITDIIEIAKSMKNIESNNISEADKNLLTYSSFSFNALYNACLEKSSLMDGISISNALSKFRQWIDDNQEKFNEEQIIYLKHSFSQDKFKKNLDKISHEGEIKIYDVFGVKN